jgi:hypothetical protein
MWARGASANAATACRSGHGTSGRGIADTVGGWSVVVLIRRSYRETVRAAYPKV